MAQAFDRETGTPVPASSLRTYADALAQYHISPESKFLNADFLDRGTTQRRHVRLATVMHIGKEAHDWERQAIIGIMPNSEIAYGVLNDDLTDQLRSLAALYGEVQAARSLGISKLRLKALLSFKSNPSSAEFRGLVAARLPGAVRRCAMRDLGTRNRMAETRSAIEQEGLRSVARRLQMDPSNLRRKLARWTC